jgi:hypothetical protein
VQAGSASVDVSVGAPPGRASGVLVPGAAEVGPGSWGRAVGSDVHAAAQASATTAARPPPHRLRLTLLTVAGADDHGPVVIGPRPGLDRQVNRG